MPVFVRVHLYLCMALSVNPVNPVCVYARLSVFAHKTFVSSAHRKWKALQKCLVLMLLSSRQPLKCCLVEVTSHL
jgi:hypothetical protein